MKRQLLALLFGVSFVVACSAPEQMSSKLDEAWDSENAPELFSLEIKKFESLPTEGMLSDEAYPWSDDYWATYAGGISRRWQDDKGSSDYKDYLYDALKAEAVIDGSVDVAKLSPAEKFDLYMNRYDFPLTKFEQDRTRKAVDPETDSVPRWFGLCHGWAPATIMEPEPGEVVTVTNEKGISIPFYTSDMKALMTHVYAYNNAETRFVGTRCNEDENKIETTADGRIVQKECRDTNPGTLHLALAEMLGNADVSKRQGFVADVTYSSEVWNQAVVGFKVTDSKVKKFRRWLDRSRRHRAPGTAHLVDVKAEVYYISEIKPHLKPMKEIKERYTHTMELSYTLELDKEGTIIGGEWTSETRPDFMWQLKDVPSGHELIPYNKIRGLFNQSLGLPAPAEEAPVDDAPAADPAE